MIFSELYSAYYNVVASIIKAAIDHPLQKNELHRIIQEHAFGESVLNIEPALEENRWQVINDDGTTQLKNPPSMPLTLLQKRWLKAVLSEPRVRLFTENVPEYDDVEPLFTSKDFYIFDKYSDGDPYEDREYIKNFRIILKAVKDHCPLSIDTENRNGDTTHMILVPEHLEYSEKDDKFRLISAGKRHRSIVNLGRIVRCRPYTKPFEQGPEQKSKTKLLKVTFVLVDEKNALERVLLHFAHFEKEAERLDDNRYTVTVTYDKDDETEIVIRILSFGPMIKVTAPQYFTDLIKKRLINQKSCGQ